MKPEEIINKVIDDMMTKGVGLVYIDPEKFYKKDPWYKRFWNWLNKY